MPMFAQPAPLKRQLESHRPLSLVSAQKGHAPELEHD